MSKRAYTDEQLKMAVEMVTSRLLTLGRASANFGIPKSTLSDKISGKHPLQKKSKTVLTEDEERQLVDWLIETSRSGCGRSKEQLLQMVQNILKASGQPNPFTDDKPGEKWYYSFMKRHPELSIRKVPIRPSPSAVEPSSSVTVASVPAPQTSSPTPSSSQTSEPTPSSSLSQTPAPEALLSLVTSAPTSSPKPDSLGVEFYLDRLLEHVARNKWTVGDLFEMKRCFLEQGDNDDPGFEEYKLLYSKVIPQPSFDQLSIPESYSGKSKRAQMIKPTSNKFREFFEKKQEEKEKRHELRAKKKRQRELNAEKKKAEKEARKQSQKGKRKSKGQKDKNRE